MVAAIIAPQRLFFYLLFSVIAIIALLEFYKIVRQIGAQPCISIGIVCLVLIFLSSYLYQCSSSIHAAIIILCLSGQLLKYNVSPLLCSLPTLVGVEYIGGLLQFLLIGKNDNNLFYLLLVFTVTWLSDTVAYAFGRKFGKHRLFEQVSPGKSVEGAVAAFITAIIVCTILGIITARFTYPQAILLGVLLGIFGQLGDLFESTLKRAARMKDSSKFVPGHGGILDVFDSVLFNAPVAYFFLQIIG